MKKKKTVYIVCVIIGVLLISNSFLSAEVIQQNTPPNFSIEILDYVLISSSQNGYILTKTYKINAKNIGIEPISNVSFILIHASENIMIIDKDVLLGAMGVNDIKVSYDTFSYSIDTSQQTGIEIDMTWEVSYEHDGMQIIDEILIKIN